MACWLIIFGIFGLWKFSNAETYLNHSLVKVYTENEDQLRTVSDFEDPQGNIEILKRSRDLSDTLDLLVPNHEMPRILKYIQDKNLTWSLKENEYGRRFELPERTARRRSGSSDVFAYHSFKEMSEMIENLARTYPNLITLQYMGNSFQGRKMSLVKVSSNPAANNPIIFIDAGIHAREWVSPAMALYLINRLATDPSSRADLNGVDWYILPLVNPDGYEYTRRSPENRLWRKTMSISSSNPSCFGVDGNRNYGFKWAVSGVSNNPCDKETYAGPRPFSEPETQIVKKIMYENKDRIKLYVSMHAYGQYLVYPWGYTGDRLPKQWQKLDRMAKIVSRAVERAGGPGFKVMSAGKWYPAAGGSDDFAFGAIGVPYSYTMELTEGYEFIYPENLLRQCLPQFFQGFRAFGREIKSEFGRRF